MPSLLPGQRNETPNGKRVHELERGSEKQEWNDGTLLQPQRVFELEAPAVKSNAEGNINGSSALVNGTTTTSRAFFPNSSSAMNGRLSESSRSEHSNGWGNDTNAGTPRPNNVVKGKDVPNGVPPTPKPKNPTLSALPNLDASRASSPPSSPSRASVRQRRAQSASIPSSPAGSPFQADYSRLDPNQINHGLSSVSNQDVAPSSSSQSLQRPGSLHLSHRHTLQVPKLPTARGSRDFSFQYGNPGEEATTTALANHGGRRPSLSLARRNTRSVNSDMYLDEIPQDADAARWAETVRQKRASRRRKKEEEEDDRVIVGTKVDQTHVNYVMAYNMLTGIRFTVSRTNAKIDRELTDADFDAKHKFSFDITGNELTPSAKYDFKFKDYAPWVFRHLRATFHLDPADYLISLTSKYILSELGSPGKSGSFFYFSRDYKYIIKTIHRAEHKLLRKILREYYAHVQENPNTLISQFYGLHRVKIPYGRKIYFVIMNNLFPPHRDIHHTFDLKGSTVGRELKEEDLEKNPRATLKDLNFLRRNYHLEFGPMKKRLFVEQLQKDVALLQRLKIMDYSLLVGIHDLERGNEENLRDRTLKVFQPGGDRSDEPQASVLVRTPSKMENAQKARELRQIIQRERPVPMNESTFQMPDEAADATRKSYFYSDDGGFWATHENGAPGEEVYYLGIIDCLTHYGFVKRLEHFWKGMSANKTQISPIPPEGYGDRFIKFISGITMSREEAQAQARAHEHPQEMQQVDGATTGTLAPPSQMQSPLREVVEGRSTSRIARRSPDQVIEQAELQVRRSGSSEEDFAERTIKVQRSSSAERRASITLPVVEEVGEAGSMGGCSGNSREREGEREIEDNSDGRSGGGYVRARSRSGAHSNLNTNDVSAPAPQNMLSPPLGGRPPPTPPKDFPSLSLPVRDDVRDSLPVLPMPELPTSPLEVGQNRSSWGAF